MNFSFCKISVAGVAKKLSLIVLAALLILAGSVLQAHVLRVRAAVNVLLVSNTAIPFGTVFPGEEASETYTVALDTSADVATYETVLSPVPDVQNLCSFLDVTNADVHGETDTLATSTLRGPDDTVDHWRVRLLVPGIRGHIAQNHEGDIVVRGGEYGCKISITSEGRGEISGIKFNDLNRNRRRDPGEPGLPGWTIRLRRAGGGALVRDAITGSDGTYAFTNLSAGAYRLREVHQSGWKRMTRNPRTIELGDGGAVGNVDFGNARRQRHEREDTALDDERDE